ncbi:hypothetical protein LTR08_008873 [Meristemomyces frigidus]|nr:hypothetical protein LTR08_008873 [Meristemomyces frigidus]
MPPQPAASASAAFTARLCLGRHLHNGEARTTSITEGFPPMIATLESGALAVTSQRLPSTRPIDYRWDRSRGMIFTNPPRKVTRDHTWTRGNGIVFGPAATCSRTYASRFRGPLPTTLPADKQKVDKMKSMVNNPNRTPTLNLAAHNEEAKRFAQLEKDLKKANDDLQLKLAASTRGEAQKETEIAELREAERKRTVEYRAALNRVREEEREKVTLEVDQHKMRYLQVVGDVKRAESEARESNAQLAQREKQAEDIKGQYSRELDTQRRSLEREHTANIEAVMQRRQLRQDDGRSSYEAYHKVFDACQSPIGEFAANVDYVEGLREQAYVLMNKQPKYTDEMGRFDPWIENSKHRPLLERLDDYRRQHCDELKNSIDDIKQLSGERLTLQVAFQGSAHASRALTRYHRLSGPPNKSATTDMIAWIANEQPFQSRRNELDTEMRAVERIIDQDKTGSKLLPEKRLRELQKQRTVMTKVIYVHSTLRKRETLQALLKDSLTEKEIFVATLSRRTGLEDALTKWRNEDNGEDRAADMLAMKREMLTRLLEYEEVVRKRSMLEQSLGEVPAQRERELDAMIREHMKGNESEERAGWETLVLARILQTSSFARPAPVALVAAMSRPVSALALRIRSSAQKRVVTSSRRGALPVRPDVLIPRIQVLEEQLVVLPDGPARDRLSGELIALRKSFRQKEREGIVAKLATETNATRIVALKTALDQVRIGEVGDQLKSLPEGSARDAANVERSTLQERVHQAQLEYIDAALATETDARRIEGLKQSKIFATRSRLRLLKSVSRKYSTLNLQPTAAKQAPHSSWPAGYRPFHERATKSHNFTDDIGALSQVRPTPVLPQHMTNEIERRDTDAFARDSTPSSLGVVNEVTDVRRSEAHECENPKPLPNSPETPLATPLPGGMPSSTNRDDAGVLSSQSVSTGYLPLTYQISRADYRNAATASRTSSAAFWTYKLYKNAEGHCPLVHFCTTLEQAEKQAQRFFGEPIIGFDLEWEPFIPKTKTGIKENVSLIQIATEDKIALFQVACFVGDTVEQLMPPSLRNLLESEQTIKAGVNITGDARRIKKFLNVDMKAQFELSHLYKVVTYANTERHKVDKKMLNLAAQVQNVLLLPLKKDEVRTSSWSKRLNMQQVEYSASDAYAGFRLFDALEEKRMKMDPMPPRPAFHERDEPLVLGDGTAFVRQPRKRPVVADKAAPADEDADEEFFDAFETLDIKDPDLQEAAGVPLSGLAVVYPTLPPLEASPLQSEQASDTQVTAQLTETARESAKPASTFARRALPSSQMSESAVSWIACWRAALPADYKVKVGHPSLKAWHLWHEQKLEIMQVASLGRDPPLTPITVASYILQAIKEEKLPYDVERVKELLDLIPSAVVGRYHRISERVRA